MTDLGPNFLAWTLGILGALITWILAGHREKQQHKRTQSAERRIRLENLYAAELSILQKAIRSTHQQTGYAELFNEMADTSSRLRLLSTQEIVLQGEVVSNALFRWSTEYLRGSPKKIGDTGVSIIASGDSEHLAKAKELWPAVNDEFNKLVVLMKDDLKSKES